jgi:glucokinase
VIGVDLGGTNVRAAAVLRDGTIRSRAENRSRAQEGAGATFEAIARTVAQAAAGLPEPPVAVGVAIAGRIDDDRGACVWSPNFGQEIGGVFHYWSGVQVREPLERLTGLRVRMGNDANLAALGEYVYGTGRNEATCLVMLTIGTGIGGGVVLGPGSVHPPLDRPVLLLGGNKGGVELGHTVVLAGGLDCNAGSYGSIEAYCQRDAIVRRARHKLIRGRDSLLRDMTGGDLGAMTPRLISEAADRGDEAAIEVWREVGEVLGWGIGNMINVFAPEVVAIGGKVARAGEWLLAPARKAARDVATPPLFADAAILQARQLEDAGVLGAAALAFGLAA